MTLHLINNDTADRLVGALCNTLVHSLWQGVLLAAAAGIIVICTRKAASALRYNLLMGAMLLFAIATTGTFAWQYAKSERHIAAALQGRHFNGYAAPVHVEPIRVFLNGQQQSLRGFPERLNSYLADHHNTIVFIWFLIVCARSLQLAFGLYGTYRLKRSNVLAAGLHWQQLMQQLAMALGIRQTITLLESGLAKVPMVIGHLKPVILVPVGLLTSLSAGEVEAILIHELAHIKRRDYLVNMLQSLMEIVFFFNPAVLWVSKLIKTERENCCDDLALAQNHNKLNYIRALVSCEEYRASVPAYAMGLTGSKGTLLDRVKRMASNRNHSLNTFEKTMLAVCLVMLGLGVSAFSARENIKKALKIAAAVIHHDKLQVKLKVKKAETDTIKNKKREQGDHLNEVLDQLQQLHPDTLKTTGSRELDALIGNVDSLKGTSSPLSGLNINKSGLTGNLSGLNANLSLLRGNSIALNGNLGSLNSPLSLLAKPDTNPMKTLMAMNPRTFNTFHKIEMELYHKQLITDTNHVSISLNDKELIVNGVRMSDELHQQIFKKYGTKGGSGAFSGSYSTSGNTDDDEFVPPVPPVPAVPPVGPMPPLPAVSNVPPTAPVPSVPAVPPVNPLPPLPMVPDDYSTTYSGNGYHYSTGRYKLRNSEMMRRNAERQKAMLADLVKDGLVTDTKNMSFSLSDKEFLINGQKQSDEIFKKYKQKYIPAGSGNNWSWTYTHTDDKK